MTATKTHRLGVCVASLVTRKLALVDVTQQEFEAVQTKLLELPGFDEATFDAHSQVVTIAYDASKLCLDGVEHALRTSGVHIGSGPWNRFKERLYRTLDDNVKANAKHEPLSCH